MSRRSEKAPNPPPIRKCEPRPADPSPVEVTLDELLDLHKKRQKEDTRPAAAQPAMVEPMEVLRTLLREELAPAFREIAKKYRGQGIRLKMYVADFLAGGREILIDLQFENHGLRLTGTVMPGRIAFQETRYIDGAPGALTSGGTLGTRNLSASRFREFVCEHISALVRSVLRQTMRTTIQENPSGT